MINRLKNNKESVYLPLLMLNNKIRGVNLNSLKAKLIKILLLIWGSNPRLGRVVYVNMGLNSILDRVIHIIYLNFFVYFYIK